MARTTTAHYYEHYPHMSGTKNNEIEFDIEKIDELFDLKKKEAKVGWQDQTWYELMNEYIESVGYAFGDILEDWPRIRRALENKGEWSGRWEEGSHAISMTSVRDSRGLVGKIEAEVFEECGEW